MKYKLYDEKIYDTPLQTFFGHRGIDLENIDAWINAGWDNISNPEQLKNMDKAFSYVYNVMRNSQNMLIIIDCDCDGFCSAAILINYLYKQDETVKGKIKYFIHKGKQHGMQDFLAEMPVEKLKEENISLVIAPDSSSNDYEQHKILHENGIDVVVLDHHGCDEYSQDAIVVNNQMCDYPNKDFAGAGIAWQFCRYYDKQVCTDWAEDLIDLCALGCAGDMMNYRSLETRAVINIGFKNIINPFFKGMVEKNKFSIDKMAGINYLSIVFYVVPFINAIQRSGTFEEKELLFKAMCEPWAYEMVDNGKRGCKGEKIELWKEAVRVVGNVKNRQTKLQNESIEVLENKIAENNLLNNAILLLLCEPGEVEKNIAGLVANKFQAKYQKPTLILTKSKEKNDKEYIYRGSARNYSMSDIEDLRQLCLDTHLTEYAQGHSNAFGYAIAESNIDKFIEVTNKILADTPQEPVYWVDYIFNINTAQSDIILSLANCQIYYGQEMPECKICLRQIPMESCNITLMSADKNPTLKIVLPSGISLIKFKSSQEEFEDFLKPNKYLTAIVKPNKNEWNGSVSAQCLIEDFELTEEWIF